jgi:hypothetical protein
VSGAMYGCWKNEGKRGEGDLKASHKGPKTEYVRTYINTFDRTRADACCVCEPCVRTFVRKFERMV